MQFEFTQTIWGTLDDTTSLKASEYLIGGIREVCLA